MTPTEQKTGQYIQAVGRRKTAIATVRITESAKTAYTVNDKALEQYFPTRVLQNTATAPLAVLEKAPKLKVTVRVCGGGIASQAEAMRHGIARALITLDGQVRPSLKKEGFLKRDPRAKERRKFGLKKARKAPQWSKR